MRVVMCVSVMLVLGKLGPIAVLVSVAIDGLRQFELGAVHPLGRRGQLIRSVSVAMPMGVAIAASAPAQVKPRGKGDPTTKSDERHARRRVDDFPEALRSGDPGKPNEEGEYQ